MACNRCKGTSSNPFNFLLSCSECGKNWHHRCHIPPLDDPELIALIRATNDNDVDNGLSSWAGRCCRRKRKQAVPEMPSRLSAHPISLGDAGHASTKSKSMDTNPPTLDLRALSLNRAPGASRAPSQLLLQSNTTSKPPSPPPPILPVKSEDDEMEDLYRPSSHASKHEPRRQRSLSLVGSGSCVLPVLAAKDPHVLAMLEGQELREAARPRRGMRKAQAVHGAGKRRTGFVLVEGLIAGWVE